MARAVTGREILRLPGCWAPVVRPIVADYTRGTVTRRGLVLTDVRTLYLAPVSHASTEGDTTSAVKSNDILCQNCVRYALKPRSNAVIYGDTLMHIGVAGSR